MKPRNTIREPFDLDGFNAIAAKALAIVSAAGIIATLITFILI